MSKFSKWMILVVTMILAAVTAGCSGGEIKGGEAERLNAALLIGHTQNSAKPELSDMEDYIVKACETYGYVSIISVEGKPYQVGEIEIPEPEKNLSRTKLETRASKYAKEILQMANQVEASTEEVNVLSALQLGARAVSTQGDGEKYLVVFHSGLSTTGALDFTKTYPESIDIEETVKKLKEEKELPDLAGTHVVWYLAGDTVKPQQELSGRNREMLKELWNKILTEAGAASVEFRADIPSDAGVNTNLPKVTPVDVLTTADEVKEDAYVYEPVDELYFDECSVQFQKNTAELLTSKEEVSGLVAELVDYMKIHKDYKVLLCGTTAAWGTQESCVELSKQRADCIKGLLVESGVPENQIITVGLGYENIFHINDMDESGNLVEDIAKKNRATVILDYSSEKAQRVMRGEQ